ncbi:MAG: hypothetical protein IH947_02440 [Bacteroidetes bacterium]|nr:hypothetical protein [Bacteroidota bacterium]
MSFFLGLYVPELSAAQLEKAYHAVIDGGAGGVSFFYYGALPIKNGRLYPG